MAASVVTYTPGVGGKAHAESLAIGANTGDVPYVLPFPSRLPSYVMLASNISIATANDHVLQLMAGSSLSVKIFHIKILQGTNATTAAVGTIEVWRLSSAGTGGTAVTAAKNDNANAAAGATGMTLATAKGTETTMWNRETFNSQQTSGVSPAGSKVLYEWSVNSFAQMLTIPAGTANGIALKNGNATAAATVNAYIEFVETSYV